MTEAKTFRKLMSQAGRVLSRRAHSRGELRRKLARHAEPDLIEPVLDRLEELKLLNDADYAYNFALCRMKQDGWGPLKVFHSLRKHDVAPELVEKAIGRVRDEAGDVFQIYMDYAGQKRTWRLVEKSPTPPHSDSPST